MVLAFLFKPKLIVKGGYPVYFVSRDIEMGRNPLNNLVGKVAVFLLNFLKKRDEVLRLLQDVLFKNMIHKNRFELGPAFYPSIVFFASSEWLSEVLVIDSIIYKNNIIISIIKILLLNI